MVDIQIRGADGLAGAYGIGPFGLSYSVSGGTNGVQVQFQIAAFDLAVKGTYSSGYKDDAGNFSIQAGAGGVIGDGQGITYFAGGGYSSQKGLIENQPHLCRLFRPAFGQSPSRWRRDLESRRG